MSAASEPLQRRVPRWFGPDDFDGPADKHHLDGLAEFDRLDGLVRAAMEKVDPELWGEYSNVLASLVRASERAAAIRYARALNALLRCDFFGASDAVLELG